MLTNREWLAVDQTGSHPRQVLATGDTVVWRSDAPAGMGRKAGSYIAVFNLGDSASTVRLSWQQMGLREATYLMRNVWTQKDSTAKHSLEVTLPSHGSALYRLE